MVSYAQGNTGGVTVPIRWINSARGFAILLVILYHAAQWSSSAGFSSDAWSEVNDSLATLRLPLFFAVSGMLAVKWMDKSWRAMMGVKVVSLAWLYLVWQAITLFVYMLVPNTATPGKGNFRELLTAVATPLVPQGALWFIWALALFFMLAKISWRLPRWLVLPGAAAISTVVSSETIQLGNVGWDGAASNLIFFLVGVSFSSQLKRFGSSLRAPVAIMFVFAWIGYISLVPDYEAVGLNLVSRGLGMVAGISIGCLISPISAISWIGVRSLNFYLPHYPILMVTAYAASVSSLSTTSAVWLPMAFFGIAVGSCFSLLLLARWSDVVNYAFALPPRIASRLEGWSADQKQ